MLSCTRKESAANTVVVQPVAEVAVPPVALLAILEAGEFPLWFQFTAGKPVQIETIDDASFSAALVPWPLASHTRFMLAQEDDVLMAVNGDGFIRFSPRKVGEQIRLYHFSGGEFWRQYTVGAFVLLDEKQAAKLVVQPTVLLYRDDRFLDSDAPLPSPRLWALDSQSGLKPLPLFALDAFAPHDGWDIDTLRRGGDGFWYFRAVKRTSQPELQMFRSDDLTKAGEKVALGAFQNAALPEPLSAAPSLLGEMLTTVLSESGSGIASVVSPEFQSIRSFATDREKASVLGFYSRKPEKAFLLAASPQGNAFYLERNASTGINASIRRFSLPSLPESFVYTGIAMCGNTIIASWEEQHEYSIGAAGFMVVRM